MALALNNKIGWHGELTFTITKDGKTVRTIKTHNIATNYVFNYLAQLISGNASATTQGVSFPNYMKLGTGTGTPHSTDTVLWQEDSSTIQTLNGKSCVDSSAQFNATWQEFQNSPTYSEIGLFDSSGNMWAHASILGGITIDENEVLSCLWSITFTAA